MIALAKRFQILESSEIRLLYEHSDDKVLIFQRAGILFVFNFHPARSHVDYRFEAPPGKYRMILDSDAIKYGGYGRLQQDQCHLTLLDNSRDWKQHLLSLYLPTRTALVLQHRTSSP
jgi:1,4-alpha-glucan branching enzyme